MSSPNYILRKFIVILHISFIITGFIFSMKTFHNINKINNSNYYNSLITKDNNFSIHIIKIIDIINNNLTEDYNNALNMGLNSYIFNTLSMISFTIIIIILMLSY